ncbi:DUF2306 domain-containing protein [Aquimarina longa]|uniref:DUF2306 domain-containing protein n=1 Tax=Aquimarina longa TaxID=1080221 RepID=UPI000780E478|nr:DUF2306 domain-containing protein [Aquimarina longa]
MKKVNQGIISILSIVIGLYPLIYLFIDKRFGLLSSKSTNLLSDTYWNFSFFTHIFIGAIALLIGWIQFHKKIREAKPEIHRLIGKIYMISVLISGVAGIYICFFATGGIISSLGFMSLGVLWLYTTAKGYWYARTAQIDEHKTIMYYSYAACFAAVTLRIWLPILMLFLEDFIIAYRITAWLCWVPNIIVAYFILNKINSRDASIDTI